MGNPNRITQNLKGPVTEAERKRIKYYLSNGMGLNQVQRIFGRDKNLINTLKKELKDEK